MCKVVIIGAGGHAKVIADIVIKNGDTLVGFLDDIKTGEVIGGYCVLGKISEAARYIDDCEFIIAIGNNSIRGTFASQFDAKWYTAIHPSAQIGLNVRIGAGTCIMANASVNSDAEIGAHCIINTGAVVEHDCKLCDFVHVSPNATLCGTAFVGSFTHIGASAAVKNNISICADVKVGVGAAIVKDICVSGTYVGVPGILVER